MVLVPLTFESSQQNLIKGEQEEGMNGQMDQQMGE